MTESNLRLVPWRNKAEWMEVYNDAYSKDITRQSKACKIMELWLQLRNDVPPGVESTANLLSALLSSHSVPEPSSRQLQLTLSTAILRVINMLCDNARVSDRQSMFSIANSYNMPHWIVTIRHDVSHGAALPDLTVLTSAATFLLTWLKEYYWEAESEQMKEITIKRNIADVCAENVQYYLNLYFDSINLYKERGNIPSSDLPSDLRERLENANSRKGMDAAIETMPWIIHARDNYTKELRFLGKGMKLSTIMLNLVTQLQDYLLVKPGRLWPFDALPILIKTMVQHSSQPEGVQLDVWEPLIQKLNSWCLLDKIVIALCNEEGGQIWVSELTKMIVKRCRIDKLQTNLSYSLAMNSVKETNVAIKTMLRRRLNLPSDANEQAVQSKLFKKIEKLYPDLKETSNLTSSVQYIVNNCSALKIIKAISSAPDINTIRLLNDLLVLLKPEMRKKKRDQLTDLVLIKLGEKTMSKLQMNRSIRTVSDLVSLESNNTLDQSEETNCKRIKTESLSLQDQKQMTSHGMEDESKHLFVRSGWDFSGCPIGVSPWEMEGCQYYDKPFNKETAKPPSIFPLNT